MSLVDQYPVIEADLEDFKKGSDISGTQRWKGFVDAFEDIWPILQGKVAQDDYRVFGIDELLAQAGVDDSRLNLVFSVLLYFAGDRAKLIDLVFQFHDSGKCHELPFSSINRVYAEDKFDHPETGEAIQDPKSKILMGYRLRSANAPA